jgi:transporter family-2 protein
VDRSLAIPLTAIVGGLIALQAPINSHLGRSTGSFQAAFVSFAIGTLVLALIAAVARGGWGTIGEAKNVAWYYLLGGVLGAAYVTTVLVTVRELGAGGVTAATIAGQLTMSVVVDHYGWLGVVRDPVDAGKVIGVLLLAAGTLLIVRS